MASEKTVRTKNGKTYYIKISSGSYYVKSPYASTWGHGTIGETRTLEDALAIIKSDAGADIERIS